MNRHIEILEAGVMDGSGGVLAGGTVTSYLAGTSTLQGLYQDFDCEDAHANPLTLSAEGRVTAYTNTRVKLVFKTSAGVTVRTVDNVGTADSDLSSSSASTLAGDGLRAPGDGTIAVNTDGVTLEISTDEVRIKDSGVSTAKLAADAVTTAKAGPILGPDLIGNCIVSCSVGASALTIALKTEAAADASASDPITIGFRSSTATSGAYNHRSVTAALSTVVSSGSKLGHTDATEWPIYVYALDNAGTVELAYSTSPVDERYVQTTTAEGGAGAADSVATLYSTTARSNVPVRLIAVLKSTQTTAGTWAAVPTNVSAVTAASPLAQLVKRPSASSASIGGIGLSASSSGTYSDTGGTLTTEDVTNCTVTITTTGRPVFLILQPTASGASGSPDGGYIGIGSSSANPPTCSFYFQRDSGGGYTSIGGFMVRTATTANNGSTLFIPCSSMIYIDTPSAGTHTYKLSWTTGLTQAQIVVYAEKLKLLAFEI